MNITNDAGVLVSMVYGLILILREFLPAAVC
ncbi:MAG: hypothetical protein JWP08_2426 [Bryobacterales bacterium]|nr:hypothetical protein [Bryobacterales bacterium]